MSQSHHLGHVAVHRGIEEAHLSGEDSAKVATGEDQLTQSVQFGVEIWSKGGVKWR